MTEDKLTKPLRERIRQRGEHELLDVIVELRREPADEAPQPTNAPRAGLIARRKQAFEDAADPVREAVQRAGGEVQQQAWLNRTLRVRIARAGLEELTGLEAVEHLDVTRGLALEDETPEPTG